MSLIPYQHKPVLLAESLFWLAVRPKSVIVDATLGGGGHSAAILGLAAGVKVIAFDQDAEALAAAQERLSEHKNIEFIHENFFRLKDRVQEKVDGILFDLGVSSYQLDAADRGFSFRQEGPLDMRMDQRQKLTAAEIVNHYPWEKLAEIFRKFGEERMAGRIARAVESSRPITTTLRLKEVVEKATPGWRKRETLSRIFQALRIAVNAELEKLPVALRDAIELLKPGGRLVVISYHSLEDRIVKRTFRQAAQAGHLKLLTKKPLQSAAAELTSNPRSRSAKLRAAEKTI